MADVAQIKVAKSSTMKKKKVPAASASHPKAYDMVLVAVKTLADKKGSSLQAIKKYISTTYKVDANKIATFIRRALKKAVTDGALIQTKGTGASGSFKVASVATKPAVVKEKKTVKKQHLTTTPKKPKAKKLSSKTSAKKTPTTKKSKKPAAEQKKKKIMSQSSKKSPAKPKAKKVSSKNQQ